MGLIVDAVDGLTGGEVVASMSVRSSSAMATGTCTSTSTCASGHFSFKLCSYCKVNAAVQSSRAQVVLVAEWVGQVHLCRTLAYQFFCLA